MGSKAVIRLYLAGIPRQRTDSWLSSGRMGRLAWPDLETM